MDIGKILIDAMVFTVVWPLMEFFSSFAIRYCFRLLDISFTCNSLKTKTKTIEKFVALYSGPEYTIHYKYSTILNITAITFMFGAGMPILFPIALCSFIVLYLVERLLVAYSYQSPPMIDETLSQSVLSILSWAPLLYCSFGSWMMSNRQIFSDYTEPVTH